MRNIYRCLLIVVALFGWSLWHMQKCMAQETGENISLTVPSELAVVFESDGTNAVGEFQISNQSRVPIHFTSVNVTEYNGWKLIGEDTTIPANQKLLVFKLGGNCLYRGNNALALQIPESAKKNLQIEVRRGAWSQAHSMERAFEMEFFYTLGQKEFQVCFDGNGSLEEIKPITAYNGEVVQLPQPFLVKHNFLGWEDEEGNLYQGQMIMPVGGISLKAKWQRTYAYAVYAKEDYSLTFVRSADPILEGSVYQGKKVTSVYTGFEEDTYRPNSLPPWYHLRAAGTSGILQVEVQDVIQPKATAYWFYCMTNITYFKLDKLDMSQVTNMVSMFSDAGYDVSGKFELTGIANWDVSNVRYMGAAFRGAGRNAKEFVMDDIKNWNTQSSEDMVVMFAGTGANGTWQLDCRAWDVRNVTEYDMFNYGSESKVIPPKWVK